MKFLEYGEEFLFDDMPKLYNPTQKVFITRLYDLNRLQLPKKIPKIYTSKVIAWRLKVHFNSKQEQLLSDENFVYLDPTKNPHTLRLNDEKRIKLYVFEESSATRNIMVLLQKDGKITHFYAGACVFPREIFLNDTFVACISMGVEKLYMDLGRAMSPFNPNELNDIIEELDRLLHYKNKALVKIQLLVGLFAHEELVAKLGNQLRGLVHLNDSFLNYHGHFLCLEHFQMDADKARIYVEHETNTEECQKHCHDHTLITVKLTNENRMQDKSNNYFEMHYSPLPSSFNLKILASIVCPGHIYGITYGSNVVPPSLPEYLRAFCRIPGKVRLPRKDKRAPSSAKPLTQDEISPSKDTPAPYCIRKTNFEYMDDESNDAE